MTVVQTVLTLMLQWGGILPPRRTFDAVALKPLGIVTKAFVTFPEYILAKNAEKKFSDISPSISNMAAENGQQTKKSSKILCYGVISFLRHIKTKFQLLYLCFQG